jgi:hypothetical protein
MIDNQESKAAENSIHSEEEQCRVFSHGDSKICYTRYNSPFWQIVIVSFVAFG